MPNRLACGNERKSEFAMADDAEKTEVYPFLNEKEVNSFFTLAAMALK